MKFTKTICTILLGFLATNTSCKTENNFNIKNMKSICVKKTGELKSLVERTKERVKEHKVVDEVEGELTEFLKSAAETDCKCKAIKRLVKTDKEPSSTSLSKASKASDEEDKGKQSTEYNKKALEWVESFHITALSYSNLDHRIIVELGKKTDVKIIEEYLSNYEIKSSGFLTSFGLAAVSIPLMLVLSQMF